MEAQTQPLLGLDLAVAGVHSPSEAQASPQAGMASLPLQTEREQTEPKAERQGPGPGKARAWGGGWGGVEVLGQTPSEGTWAETSGRSPSEGSTGPQLPTVGP